LHCRRPFSTRQSCLMTFHIPGNMHMLVEIEQRQEQPQTCQAEGSQQWKRRLLSICLTARRLSRRGRDGPQIAVRSNNGACAHSHAHLFFPPAQPTPLLLESATGPCEALSAKPAQVPPVKAVGAATLATIAMFTILEGLATPQILRHRQLGTTCRDANHWT